ncbi:hypothetical protein QVD17_00850 [Tagetes erecta]|uniref:Transposase (putative) gypsy type domain-containing protein n=1 Tax=Tagetes erecta TaxID=13708 RepID=A0AAD8P0Y0_TARER|nr:hypothetical protein QVD17_00850 [Tagetes erecta]
MHLCYSKLTDNQLQKLIKKYDIPADLHPTLPPPQTSVYPLPPGKIALYTHFFKTANCRVPFTRFLIKILLYYGIHISQCAPLGIAKIMHFEISCRAIGEVPDLVVFRKFFHITKAGDWYTFERRRSIALSCFTSALSGLKNWKDNFFYVDDRCIPSDMVWRPNNAPPLKDTEPSPHLVNQTLFLDLASIAHPVRKYPEHLLVIGWISRKWPYALKWPTMSLAGKEIDLSDVLQLDSFEDLTFEGLDMEASDQTFLDRTTSAFQTIRPPISPTLPGNTDTVNLFEASQSTIPIINLEVAAKRKKTTAAGTKKKIKKNPDGINQVSTNSPPSHSSSLENLSSHLQGEDINRESLAKQIRQQKTPETHDPVTFLNKTPVKPSVDVSSSHFSPSKSPEHTPSPPIRSTPDPPSPFLTPPHQSPLPQKTANPSTSTPASLFKKNSDHSAWVSHEVRMSPLIGHNFSYSAPCDPDQPFIPNWNISNKDSVLDIDVARQFLHNATTPKDLHVLRNLSPMEFSNGAHLHHAQTIGWFSEMHRRWVEAEMKVSDLTEELSTLQSSACSVHQLEQKLIEKTEALQETKTQLTKVQQDLNLALKVSAQEITKSGNLLQEKNQLDEQLKKNVADQELMKKNFTEQSNELLIRVNAAEQAYDLIKKDLAEKEKVASDLSRTNASLKDQLSKLHQDSQNSRAMKDWLFAEGLDILSKKITKSPEMVTKIAAVNNSMRQLGYRDGVKAGYAYGSRGKSIEEVRPAVIENIQSIAMGAIKECGDVKFQLVSDLQANPQISLSELQKRLGLTVSDASSVPPNLS